MSGQRLTSLCISNLIFVLSRLKKNIFFLDFETEYQYEKNELYTKTQNVLLRVFSLLKGLHIVLLQSLLRISKEFLCIYRIRLQPSKFEF